MFWTLSQNRLLLRSSKRLKEEVSFINLDYASVLTFITEQVVTEVL